MSSATSETAWRWEHGTLGINTLWFDQPGRSHNVLDLAAFDELEARLTEAESDRGTRGLVIRSAKPAGFCAGADLKTILTCTTRESLDSYFKRGQAVLDRLAALSITSVAVLHGVCLGGGLELALACRRRVALASAVPLQAGSPEVQRGLIPGWGAITRLPRLIGPNDAVELLVSGRSFGYLMARSLGFVDRLAAEEGAPEITELVAAGPTPAKTWPLDVWESACERGRALIEEQPGEYPDAQLKILEIIAVDVARGPEAATTATLEAIGELAASEETRAGLLSFFQHRSQGSDR
jgi:3-hydroxyacyl-CoA dehydrogenase/enoyl-CoA hydratase/3-hydroxybutyryl-CoA epimerase